MAVVVSLRELIDELKILSSEHRAYLNRVTGRIVTVTDEDISAVEKDDDAEERQDWKQEVFDQAKEVLSSGDYLELPNRFDIHEFQIMEKFCSSFPDERIGDVLLDKIRGAGAFRRFKDTIYTYGIEKEWFKFQDEAFKEIAISWLERNKITYSDN